MEILRLKNLNDSLKSQLLIKNRMLENLEKSNEDLIDKLKKARSIYLQLQSEHVELLLKKSKEASVVRMTQNDAINPILGKWDDVVHDGEMIINEDYTCVRITYEDNSKKGLVNKGNWKQVDSSIQINWTGPIFIGKKTYEYRSSPKQDLLYRYFSEKEKKSRGIKDEGEAVFVKMKQSN